MSYRKYALLTLLFYLSSINNNKSVGPKDLSAPTYQTIKPKGPGRGGKRPRMTKEGPKILGEIVEDRHVLGELVPWKGRAINHPPQPSPSFPNEGTSVGGQLWEHGERAIVKESVTSALNARSWQSSRINEWMTPEQCHPVYYNSQQVEGSTGWDRHSSSNLHKQQLDSQDEGSIRIYNQRGLTKRGDCNSENTWRP